MICHIDFKFGVRVRRPIHHNTCIYNGQLSRVAMVTEI